ncbi:DUF551 domain-containing protein [Klebsiella pneumoniae]|uniref:DUF551 domain-containing protein n=1 Tax=Klebsiella pneumoniae TaxID=573 RepID=UPI0035181492
MTKSTITREQLEEWVAQFDEDGGCDATDMQLEALIRQSLAAMDSEPEYLPLDYLQGQKDGLEWAAQLAEANHPETGDWLYDDPTALAKAIRKGPDMPPAQPVEYSEPVAWTWQHLKQWHVTNDEARARDLAWDGVKVEPLYRHAQPAPVVSAELLHTAASAIEDLLTTKDRTGAFVWFDLPFRLRSAANAQPVTVVPDDVRQALSKMDDEIIAELDAEESACRAAMLHAGNSPAQSDCCPAQNHVFPAQNVVSPAQSPIDHGYLPECECAGCKATARICAELSVNSPANPGCWCRTCRPVDLNDMRFVVCPDCGNKRCPRANDHRNACTGSNEPGQEGSAHPDTPHLPGSEPATVPGKWIPVSERMPETDGNYWGWWSESKRQGPVWFIKSELQAQFQSTEITHWMPLPAAPQEAINALIPLVSRNDLEGK